jgi:glycosyltransferase involved in cell wall biosynthesis
MFRPLVSILIPAYNAQEWIGDTIRSAIAQTWANKEIIVVDDGSTDRTANVASGFGVMVISTKNGGLSTAQNNAYRHSHGDYIQWLDADDILAPDKIERQLAALRESDSKNILLSSPWAPFYYRIKGARFVHNSLWKDLTPVEWLLAKLSENIHMQSATWLVSREITEAAGPWDEYLHYDQDGEYFARVLLASECTRFVSETGIFYRSRSTSCISYIGDSNIKKESLLRSMKLHIQYLRSLEESERVRKACLIYIQNWYHNFYPERPDIVAELQSLAKQLGGHLEEPSIRWKYAWMKSIFGLKAAKQAQMRVPQIKISLLRSWDKTIYGLKSHEM